MKKMKLSRKFILILFLIGFLSTISLSQDKSKAVLKSPYHTVLNHFKYLQKENFKPELASRSLYGPDLEIETKIDLAIKLKRIYDSKGLEIQINKLPRNIDYYDSLRDEAEFIVHEDLPALYLKRYGNRWQYSEESVQSINEIYDGIFILGTDKLVNLFPKSGQNSFLGIQIWQYLGILIIITFAVILERLFEFIFLGVIRRFLVKKGSTKIANKLVQPVTRPFSLFMVLSISLIFIPVLQLPIQVAKYVILGIKAVIPLLLTIVVYKMVDLFSDFLLAKAEETESTLDDQLVPLVRKILKIFVVIVGGLFVLMNLNVNIIPLLTGLSIGSLALALAAQDTLKNFFGSVMIFVDRPFQIGQWITSGDVDGTVEEVGFRSTRIRTFRNSLVYVPNGKIADSTIDNHGLRNYRRFYTKIGVMYDTPPDLMEVFVQGLRDLVDKHPKTVKDSTQIHFNEMGDFSLNIMFYIFFDVPTWKEELIARDEILMGILRLAENLSVNFAFPTQTLHMETFPGKDGLSPTYEMNKDKMIALKDKFITQYNNNK
jgi:MscS family membrane protein